MPVDLDLVQTAVEIRETLTTFNADAQQNAENAELAKRLLRDTSYWVYDPQNETFGPSKFVAFRHMNFPDYAQARDGNCDGDRFNGHVTRTAIERILGTYTEEQQLSQRLILWGERLLGPGIFDNIMTQRWRFVSL